MDNYKIQFRAVQQQQEKKSDYNFIQNFFSLKQIVNSHVSHE